MIGLLTGLAAQAAPTTSTTQPCIVDRTSGAVQGLCTGTKSLHIAFQYRYVAPELILIGGALAILTVSALLPKRSRRGLWMLLTVVVGLCSFASAALRWNDAQSAKSALIVGNALVFDGYSLFFAMLISSAIVLSALISDSYLRREGLDGPEFYVLALLSGSGAMIMAAANDLIVVFLGLEILSIALYVMAAYHRRRAESGEASMKYFILGAFSSAIFLYGVALCYGATGSTRLSEIAVFLAHTHVPKSIVLAGVVLLIVGLGFKVAAVPFHAWTPDVYQGSPTPATGFMAAVAKAGGFAALIRIMMGAFPTLSVDWRPVIWALAALTLLVGSILAIVQTDIKRMLAYSSISHAGYVLVGLQAANGAGTAGALFYLFSYSFMVLGSFAIVSVVSGKGEARNDVGGFRGLALRRPGLALAFTVLLLAQAGVPFTTGFFAKFYVVSAAVGQRQYVLAVLAMLAAAVATFFYLRVAIFMYSPLASETAPAVAATAGGGGGASAGAAGAGASGGSVAGGGSAASGSAASGGSGASGSGASGSMASGSVASGGSAASGSGATAGVAVLGGLALADPPETSRIPIPATIYIALFFCLGFTIVFGVWPAPMIHFARHATLFF